MAMSSSRSSYKGSLLDVPPLSYSSDDRKWARQMKHNFDTRLTNALTEKYDVSRFAATKQEKADREEVVRENKLIF